MRRLVLSSFAIVLAACTHVATTGATCVLNSDCVEPLVCAGMFCRAQCRLDRDCARGETCQPDPSGSGSVCVPSTTADASVPDAGASDAATDAGPGCADETLLAPTMRTFQFTYHAPSTSPAGPTCAVGAAHRYYRLHVAERALVIVYANGVDGQDMLGWVSPDCGITTGCSGTCGPDLEMAAALDPGDYRFVVESIVPSLNVSIISVPLPADVPVDEITTNTFDVTASLATSVPTIANTCGATGPSHVWWTRVCLPTDAHSLDVASCGSAPNVDLFLYSDATGAVSTCGAADPSCTSGGRVAHQALRLAGPTVVLVAASGHGATDTGTVHLVGGAT